MQKDIVNKPIGTTTFCYIDDGNPIWKECRYHFADKRPDFDKRNQHLKELEYIGEGIVSTVDGIKQDGTERLHFWINKDWIE